MVQQTETHAPQEKYNGGDTEGMHMSPPIPLWDKLNQSFYLNNVGLWEEGVEGWKKQWTMIAKVAFFLTYHSKVWKMGKVSDILSKYVEVLYPCYPLMP